MVLVEMAERVDKNLLERFLGFDSDIDTEIEIDPVTCVLQKKSTYPREVSALITFIEC